MSENEERIDIERQRLRLEELKFQHFVATNEKKYKAERFSKFWSPLLTLIPILAIIVGYYFNTLLESEKNFNARDTEISRLKRQFIDRQLAEFYYPIKLRLEKDTAVWILSDQLIKGNAKVNPDFSKTIENGILIPNHDEIIGIISTNFNLLKNSDENFNPGPLINSINQYQRHVAAYKTLRKLEIYSSNPIQVCKACGFPTSLPSLISSRIEDLEKQREALSKNPR